MNRVFFTADPHFAHKKLAVARGFPDVESHDRHLIDMWNDTVKAGDRVYVLGDFSFGGTQRTLEIIDQLQGQIYIILGNHDKLIAERKKIRDRFVKVCETLYLKIKGVDQKFWLTHCANMVWPSMQHGVIHLFGHSHGSLISEQYSQQYWLDVGLDTNGLRLYSLEDVMNIMSTRSGFKPVDQHGTRSE